MEGYKKVLVVVSLVQFLVQSSFGLINLYPAMRALEVEGDPGERLFLTPYIRNNDVTRARELARVPPILGVESYSGFLTINDKNNSNMFFWFFPAESDPGTAPLAVWLQGGPGAPSMFALFEEHGPFIVNEQLVLEKRPFYWTRKISIIYIDNPVGTGFSFTDPNGYVSTESEVGENLYETLLQFFQLFPEYQKTDFFVTGESYGGKYVPALAYTIHMKNPTAQMKINLKGVAIGNGLFDPENMILKYGDYLYYLGLIDSKTLVEFNTMENDLVSNIKSGNFRKAFEIYDVLINGDMTSTPTLFYNATGMKQYFNYVTAGTKDSPSGPFKPTGNMQRWLAKGDNRKKIHVGPQKFDEGHLVEEHLLEDVMNSVKPWLQILMDNYRVLLYNGQFDIICAYPLMMNFVEKLQWSGKTLYDSAARKPWFVNGELAGFTKTGGNFTEILVRNAGHMVPTDQPVWALDMITKFTQNIPF